MTTGDPPTTDIHAKKTASQVITEIVRAVRGQSSSGIIDLVIFTETKKSAEYAIFAQFA